jgi:putative transposase
MGCLDEGLEDALTVMNVPHAYRKRLRTTNVAERMNAEIRRREKVIRVFPNEEAALRLMGALLAEKQDEWLEGNRYLDMAEYWDRKREQESNKASLENANVVHINEQREVGGE